MHDWQHHPTRKKEFKCTKCGAESVYRQPDDIPVIRLKDQFITYKPDQTKQDPTEFSLDPETMQPRWLQIQIYNCDEAVALGIFSD